MAVLRQIQVHPSQGLKQTLFQMNVLEQKAIKDVAFVRWVFARFGTDCIPCLPGKIWKYMQNNFEFKDDEPDEFIAAPYVLIETRQGDCDDFALFSKTCLDIIGGWYARYLLLAKNRNAYTHICVFAHRGKRGQDYNDPIYLDGANQNFNVISKRYNYYKII